ncbi:hypothetical protein KIN20_018292 [Parelaphostrongylus tenuis]|uniref:Uncharacterized protein n=1 Tax=Parelaphostrongylus tenuis TaxID=148309 RepID=A0AAD5QRD3_PARTN|nr:hypothetical protein KIN20_018292 [Parelaphostrongylus tenuis]
MEKNLMITKVARFLRVRCVVDHLTSLEKKDKNVEHAVISDDHPTHDDWFNRAFGLTNFPYLYNVVKRVEHFSGHKNYASLPSFEVAGSRQIAQVMKVLD